jgi:hypothetical protein
MSSGTSIALHQDRLANTGVPMHAMREFQVRVAFYGLAWCALLAGVLVKG